MLVSLNVSAYSDDKGDDKCRDPKIQEFNLPEYKTPENKEVQPESEFSFVVSGWSDTKKIKVMGKNKPVPFTVESFDTFHRIKGKLPADFTGQYVRLNVRIPAILGCYSNQGWLLKVADKAKAAEEAPTPANLENKGTTPLVTETPTNEKSAPAAAKPESSVEKSGAAFHETDSVETPAKEGSEPDSE